MRGIQVFDVELKQQSSFTVNSQMQLTIHRGAREIGGNCVELAASNTRLVIDVGMPLVDADQNPFDARATRKKSVSALLSDGTLPQVQGLFAEGLAPDAILLSHAHSDHSGLLHLTRPDVPIHLSRGTSKMLHAGSIFAGQDGLKRQRERIFEAGGPFQIGDFAVTAYSVDHSAFDSMAFIIEANGKRLLYSGDLRLHGRKPWMASQLLLAAKQSPIDVLLMEGTHFSAGRQAGITEQELEDQVAGHIGRAPGIALAAFSPLHLDRLVTFYKAARRSGRTFIVDPYAAYVMHLASGQCRIPKPSSDAGIRVYYNQYFEESHDRRRIQKIHAMFVQNRIELDEILKSPSQHVMVFRTSMLDRDFGGNLPSAAQVLYSYWAGYLQRPEWVELQAKLTSIRGEFIEAHTSGHIFAADIVKFVKAVNPRIVIPIHTFEPDRFSTEFGNARVLKDRETFELSDFEAN